METPLRRVIESVSNTYGDDFLGAITLSLADIIGADYTFIARLDKERRISRTLALAAQGALQENFEYSLDSTPCSNVADDSVCLYPSQVTKLFPDDQLLIDMGIEAYLGTPLRDSHGDVIGLIVALYQRPINDESQTLTLFNVFSGRIAAELERQSAERELLNLNQELEQRVYERTQALSEALDDLKQAQNRLIESEKIAALGNLVASIAHEINTPLGVAITGNSLLSETFNDFKKRCLDRSLNESDLQAYVDHTEETIDVIQANLQRAKALINNFKHTAVDQDSDVKEIINLQTYYQQIMSTLSPMTRQAGVIIELNIDDNVLLDTYPGLHAQIITNLVSNSIRHGFVDGYANAKISIATTIEANEVLITYRDNGIGLNDEERLKIFEPFFTTKRNKGGTGLGMSVVYNAVKQRLNGRLALVENIRGFGLQIRLPIHISTGTPQQTAS